MKFAFYALVVLLAVTLLNFEKAYAEKVMHPNIKEMKLWHDEKYVTHKIVIDAKDSHINASVNVLQKLHNVDIHIEGTIMPKENTNYFLNFNTSLNFCNVLLYSLKSPVGALIAAFLKDYGHITEKCPINKGSYYLRKIWLPEDPILSTLGEVDFAIKFLAYYVDDSNQRNLIINDNFIGEMVLQDVAYARKGLFTLLKG